MAVGQSEVDVVAAYTRERMLGERLRESGQSGILDRDISKQL